MPVTQTAKRALRSSKRKGVVNTRLLTNLEAAIRIAKNKKSQNAVSTAMSLSDRAAKRNIVHRNKASRIKSSLSRLLSTKNTKTQSSEKSSK